MRGCRLEVASIVAAVFLSALLLAGCQQSSPDSDAALSAESLSTSDSAGASVANPGESAQSPGDEGSSSSSSAAEPLDSASFVRLLIDLVEAYENSSQEASLAVSADLSAMRSAGNSWFDVASVIVESWNSVYANPDYQLYTYGGGDRADELEDAAIPRDGAHAFVVLGFQLVDGEMQDELKGRCDAAAAAARSYPHSILVCSGGPTGDNNPGGHTEAGLMKAYLVDECGVDESRVHIDERALSTAENALNTMDILREQNVKTITLVTSSYHQRRAQVLYATAAALFKLQRGYEVGIVGNYSYPVDAASAGLDMEDRVAVRQIAQILGLSDEEIESLPAVE